MGSWPDPTPFEAEDGSASSSLDDLIRGPGAVLPGLLLLAGSADGARAAARDTAIRLARAWIRTGRRTVLADLEFDTPGLHALLGIPNDQGVADHFAFGTSFQQLAWPVDDGAWSLVPAGPWVPDGAAVLRSPEWQRVLLEFADGDATLLAFCPADAAGVGELAAAFGAVVVLGDLREVPGVRGFSVIASFALPAGTVPGLPAPAESAGEQAPPAAESADEAFERIRLPTDARTREALIADLRIRQRAARMAPSSEYQRPSLADLDAGTASRPSAAAVAAGVLSPEAAAVPAEPGRAAAADQAPSTTAPLSEPQLAPRLQPVPSRRSYRPLWWTVAVIALLSLLAGSWHFVRGRIQTRRQDAGAQGAVLGPAARQQPVASPPVRAADTVLAYTLSVGEHVRLPSAEQRAAALRAALPGTSFFISPVVRDDALYYAVLAGPVADSLAGAALRDTLAARDRAPASGAVRLAPYAFLLGDYASADSARARVEALRRLEIPSHVLPVAGPPPRFRVYAGSYTGPVDAEVMKQILQSVGEPDVLVPRFGRR